ncbi:MAG: trimeric autotransporter adhesin [Verrucomicrobiota bacterium]|jgi:hypothetical protein
MMKILQLGIPFRAWRKKSCCSALVAAGLCAANFSPAAGQEAYLKASNTGVGDEFGFVVAIFGDTMVVGAPGEDSSATGINGSQGNDNAPNSGAVYVYVRNGTNWTQQAYLKASNSGADDLFGCAVAISSNTLVVGAYQERSSATGVNGNQANNSASGAGAAYVFVRNGTNWTQQAYLKASNSGASEYFGWSVAISGDTLVVGAPSEPGSGTGVNANQADQGAMDAGAAYVFVRNGTTWTQQAYLKASNTSAQDYFGGSVAMSGNTVVVGAWGEDSNATGVNGDQDNNSALYSGAAYVFVRTGGTWTQQAYLKASNSRAGDDFGFSVAIATDTIVVGALYESGSATGVNGTQNIFGAADSGAAYVFQRSGTVWTQQAYLKAANAGAGDHFGAAVAVADGVVVVSADSEASNATGQNGDRNNDDAPLSGAAYVFMGNGTSWSQQAYLKASNTDAGDFFGDSVAVWDKTVVVGAYQESSSAIGVNGNQSNNNSPESGAVYVFNGFDLGPTLTLESDGGSGYFLHLYGKPGLSYRIQRASNPAGPWYTLVSVTAPSSGTFGVYDTSAPFGHGYYRAAQP